jgi:hypothetical protein
MIITERFHPVNYTRVSLDLVFIGRPTDNNELTRLLRMLSMRCATVLFEHQGSSDARSREVLKGCI